VDNVPSAVLRDVVADAGHQRAEEVVGADEQPGLLAGMESQAERRKIDLDLRDLAGLQLLDPVEGVGGGCVRSRTTPGGNDRILVA